MRTSRDHLQYATTHYGLVTMERFVTDGHSRSTWYRRTNSGLFIPMYQGVARLPGVPQTRQQSILAAVLACGPGAMASHRSAAYLAGVDRPDDDPFDVIVTRSRRAPEIDGVVVHRPRDTIDIDPVWRHGIPSSKLLRWGVDLGAVDELGVHPAVGYIVANALARRAP